MTTGRIDIAESPTPGKRLATYEFPEDSVSKSVQRVSLNGENGNLMQGQKTASGSVPVVIASDQPQLPTSLGQKTSNGSLPVVLPSDQTVAINLASLAGTAIDGSGIATKTIRDYAEVSRYFAANVNPTVSTGVALNAAGQTTFVATAPSILISAGAKAVTLDRLAMQVTGAGAGVASLQCAVVVDTANRFTSGGTTIAAKATTTLAASACTVRVAGTTAIVAAAAGAGSLLVGRTNIRSGTPVIGEVYSVEFGGASGADGVFGTRFTIKLPPVRIPANGSALVYLWGPGQTTAPTYEAILYLIE